MLDKNASGKALDKFFKNFPVATIEGLKKTLKTESRMSIFRRLNEIGYLSSYTHSGRYYTVSHIPHFDKFGLWFYQGIGFSQAGSLKATIAILVDKSPAGLTHGELTDILRVRVHNTLLTLSRETRIDRQKFNKMFLYISPDFDKGSEQLSNRDELSIGTVENEKRITDHIVIEVLMEIIRTAELCIAPFVIANRLSVRGLPISVDQVKRVFLKYEIDTEKKSPSSDLTF